MKHPNWKQNTPKDQMTVILMALEGNIENIHIISLKKLVEKVKDCIEHLKMLSEYMNSKWEDKMNLGEKNFLLLKEELRKETNMRNIEDKKILNIGKVTGIKIICNNCKMNRFTIYTKGINGWQFKCEYCGLVHNIE